MAKVATETYFTLQFDYNINKTHTVKVKTLFDVYCFTGERIFFIFRKY